MSYKLFDIVALGEAMLEFNQTRAGEPRYLQGFGGDTSNAAIAAARAGARTAYLTRVGADWCGERLLDLWRQEGVDVSGIDADPLRPTGIYFVQHGPAGHEFSYRRAGSAASAMTPEWLPARIVRQSRILHVSGISLAISDSARQTVLAAMRVARAAGTRVSLDSNLRLQLWSLEQARAVLAEAMELCDLFLPSLEDMEALVESRDIDTVLAWARQHGAQTTVLKLGAQGCIVSDCGERMAIPGRPVTPVDATGAGDCFCGNLLARIAAGDSVFEAARYANVAAALAVQGYGAVAPLPHAAQVQLALQCLAPAQPHPSTSSGKP